jgi:hypothetical protein
LRHFFFPSHRASSHYRVFRICILSAFFIFICYSFPLAPVILLANIAIKLPHRLLKRRKTRSLNLPLPRLRRKKRMKFLKSNLFPLFLYLRLCLTASLFPTVGSVRLGLGTMVLLPFWKDDDALFATFCLPVLWGTEWESQR